MFLKTSFLKAAIILISFTTFIKAEIPSDSLKEIYIAYLNAIGTRGEEAIESPLIASNCRKVVNGSLVAKGKGEVEKQLREARTMGGMWNVTLLDDTHDPIKQKFTVHYNLSSKKAGAFTVIAIVKYTHEGKIEEINEVYQPISSK